MHKVGLCLHEVLGGQYYSQVCVTVFLVVLARFAHKVNEGERNRKGGRERKKRERERKKEEWMKKEFFVTPKIQIIPLDIYGNSVTLLSFFFLFLLIRFSSSFFLPKMC